MDLSLEAKMGLTLRPSPHRTPTVLLLSWVSQCPLLWADFANENSKVSGNALLPFCGKISLAMHVPTDKPLSRAGSQLQSPGRSWDVEPPLHPLPREGLALARFTATHTAVSSQGEGFLLMVSFTSQ